MNKNMIRNSLEKGRVRDHFHRAPSSRVRDIAEAPKRESTARRRGRFDVGGERLRPLVRWLDSRCGREWDSIWAEICELPPSWTGRAHIAGHVRAWLHPTHGRYHIVDGILRRR